jgi:hypothetical protein
VTRVGEVDTANWGHDGFVLADWQDAVLTRPVRSDGWLIPSTFRVDGLGFDCQFDVGRVDDGRPRYGITRLTVDAFAPDTKYDDDPVARASRVAPCEPNLDRISLSALTRLALRAVAVRVLYVPQGTVLDGFGGAPTDVRLREGDRIPPGTWVAGVRVAPDGRIRYDRRPEPVLLSLSGKVASKDVRVLMGQRKPGRRVGAWSDPSMLGAVAHLYRQAADSPDAHGRVPAWVSDELARVHGVYVGESWVRQKAVQARRAGILTTGKRKRRRKGGK